MLGGVLAAGIRGVDPRQFLDPNHLRRVARREQPRRKPRQSEDRTLSRELPGAASPQARPLEGGLSRLFCDERSVSSGRQIGAFVLTVPIFFIIMLAVGGMHPAIDSTAGERENSTWETVMTTATSRANVLIAKYLYVATLAFTAAFLNLFAMMLSMGAVLAPLFGESSSLRIPIIGAAGFGGRCAVIPVCRRRHDDPGLLRAELQRRPIDGQSVLYRADHSRHVPTDARRRVHSEAWR